MGENDKTKKKKEKPLNVTTSNQLQEIPLQNFNSVEINFYWGLLFKLQGKGLTTVEIGFDEFRALTGYTRRGDKALLEQLRHLSFKFSEITLLEELDNGFHIMIPFYDFKANTEKKTFSVKVNEEFIPAINNLDGRNGRYYTRTDLIAMRGLKSTYSKHCLKMLFLYRNKAGKNKGCWTASVKELKYYLDIPDKYRTSDINKLLDSVVKEYEEAGIFEKFDITPIYENNEEKRKKGRKKTIGYTMLYSFVEETEEQSYADDKKDEYSIPCPVCGKPLYRIERKDGSTAFYGHRTGWDKGCNYTIREDKLVEANGEVVSEHDPVDGAGGTVSKGDLEKYYRYVREQQAADELRRKEYIRTHEPEILSIYEECAERQKEIRDMMTSLALSEESRERKKAARERLELLRNRLKDALLSKGYESDYMDLRYKCSECKDFGQRDDGSFCSCRAERAKEAAEWIKGKL